MRKKFILIFLCVLVFYATVDVHQGYAQDIDIIQLNNSATRILDEGINAGDVNKIKEALILLHKGIDINPNYYQIIKKITQAYYILGDFDKAKKYLYRGLSLKRDDTSLYILEIFFELRDENLEKARVLIDTFKNKYPYDADILYMEIIYYTMAGDEEQVGIVLGELQRKFGKSERYSQIYQTMRAITYDTTTLETDSVVLQLQNNYSNQLWIQWLLTSYYVESENTDLARSQLNLLESSGISYLEKYAFKEKIFSSLAMNDLEAAIAKAREYTNKYKEEPEAWSILGVLEYRAEHYKASERSLNRMLVLQRSVYNQFLYNTVLKNGDEHIASAREKKMNELLQEARWAYRDGNSSLAEFYINQAIYINPLDKRVRRMNVDILDQRGDYAAALEELNLLISLGYEETGLENLINTYDEKLNTIDEATSEALHENLLVGKIWKIELGEISYKGQQKNIELFGSLQRKMYEYYLSQSDWITWYDGEKSNEAKYTLDIEYVSQKNSIVAKVFLRDKFTHEQLLVFNRIYLNDNFVIDSAKEIKNILDQMMPETIEIVYVDSLAGTVILDTDDTKLEVGAKYIIYPNRNVFDFRLLSDGNHFFESEKPIGYATIEEIYTRHVKASISGIFDESTSAQDRYFSQLRLLQSIQPGDFILLPPQDWNSFSIDDEIVKDIESQYYKNRLITYLLNVLLIDFF